MNKELSEAFCKAKYPGDQELCENVWKRVILESKHAIRIKLWILGGVIFISVVGFVSVVLVMSKNSDVAEEPQDIDLILNTYENK